MALTTSSLSHAVAAIAGGRFAGVLPSSLAARFGLCVLDVHDLRLAPATLWATTRKVRPRGGASIEQWRDAAAAHCARVTAPTELRAAS